jgi:hypothetical protein
MMLPRIQSAARTTCLDITASCPLRVPLAGTLIIPTNAVADGTPHRDEHTRLQRAN